ncbi:MAG: nucleotidyltransferase family protein [Thermoproteus sp.]
MKAFLLAAGLGTRLRPLTYFAPKPLVVLGGRTIIDYALEWLRANGVGEIYVVGLYMQEVLASYLREHHPDVVFVPSKKLLGTAGQLYYARGYMDDGPALVAPSDVVTDLDVKAAADFHVRSSVDLTVVGREVETEVRFGVLDVAEGRLSAWREKPRLRHVVSTGIYVAEGSALRRLEERRLDFDEFARSLMPRVAVYVSRAKFLDVGTLGDLDEVRRALSVINI